MSNRLATESSPYLLQHADNPVDWYPWGEEAFRRAREENRPILLSIGYAACHWCHVMAHESFEDPATAQVMNRHFVNIKVDREERPDIDAIYMAAVTAMTGHGGWPLTAFLTPEGKPFHCGTYYPPEPRYGSPSFGQVLAGIREAWQTRADEVLRSAERITQHLREPAVPAGEGALAPDLLRDAVLGIAARCDGRWGGFGAAPKFPHAMVLEFLLREHLRSGAPEPLEMAQITLERMAAGGIYDHLGGGFARYSTDAHWLVPHFEKMLYDNALLARVYLHAWQITRLPRYRQVVEETLDWALREMRHPAGGFWSSQDADSEGVEGKFFVWSAAEVTELLGADALLFMRRYGVSGEGNWEGSNILHLAVPLPLAAEAHGLSETAAGEILDRCRACLFERREQRIRPGLDDKVLTAWNGLMLAALAEAGRVLGRADYLAAAVANAEFLRGTLRRPDGRLRRSWKDGSAARFNAYLEDHACLADGLLALYEATFEPRWYEWCEEIARIALQRFADPGNATFFDTPDDHETLITRPRDVQDNAVPSGNARLAAVLFRLYQLSGDRAFARAVERSLGAMTALLRRYPLGFGEWLGLACVVLGRPRELALAGPLDVLGPMRAVVNEVYRPELVVAAGSDGLGPPAILHGRRAVAGQVAAYLCEKSVCQAPVTEPDGLRRLLGSGS